MNNSIGAIIAREYELRQSFQIYRRIREIFSEFLDISPEQMHSDMRIDDLCKSARGRERILCILANDFQVKLPDKALESAETIYDVLNLIKRAIVEKDDNAV